MPRALLVVAVVLLCAACGSGNAAATVNGTVAGQEIGAQDAIFNVFASGSDSEAAIGISNAANSCALVTASKQPKNARAIAIALATQTATTTAAPSAAGTWNVVPDVRALTGNVAVATYVATDGTCIPIHEIQATSGTVTLTRVDASGYGGTFDLRFTDGSHVTGSFTASRCAALGPDASTGTCT